MYSQQINRRQPALLMLLIDQSASMNDRWAGLGQSKAQVLADAVNETLHNATLSCNKGGNRIYDYFEVGAFGYGADIRPVLAGTSVDTPAIPVSEFAQRPKRIEQRTSPTMNAAGHVVTGSRRLPIWIEPSANGLTPMTQAFTVIEPILSSWCAVHRSSFPPIVINVTDGESTDGDPTAAAHRVRMTGTDDGPTLLFNVHLSTMSQTTFAFPSTAVGLPDGFARLLFELSSELPKEMLAAAAQVGYEVDPGARGLLYNSGTKALFHFLDIGTRAVTPNGLRDLRALPS
ncbi:VWA domain-containing protein [Nocardia elegans]|uniref:VWA domain-containing protein n=1 Tax=Nocardia elegans TaxID=300029 RepID=A0ABW6TE36_9NOCA